jgi:hypothetical protein
LLGRFPKLSRVPGGEVKSEEDPMWLGPDKLELVLAPD